MSLYVAAVIPLPDLGRANRPRFAASAASFSLSANTILKFTDGSNAIPPQKSLWIKIISDSAGLDLAVSGMHCKQLIAKISLLSLIDINVQTRVLLAVETERSFVPVVCTFE